LFVGFRYGDPVLHFVILTLDSAAVSHLLFESLHKSPLLVGDLPEAASFSRVIFGMPEDEVALNLRQKLGHLYEDALGALFESSEQVEVIERNLQIQIDRHQTVGELDYLLRDREREGLVHLELAVKFYLAVDSEDGMMFPGPDARDDYYRKLKRLRAHQLVLPGKFSEHLPSEYRAEAIRTEQLIYGCLFDHVSSEELAHAEFINPNCRRGRWLREDEEEDYLRGTEKVWVIPKALWPVPFPLLEGVELERWDSGQGVDRCVMVKITGDERPHFIMPSGYPGR
jgi:hypothetical protein